MKQLSFRLRFAILSAFLAGGALTGFCLISWSLIYNAQLIRLDSEIKDRLLQESLPPTQKTDWLSYEMSKISLPSVSGKEAQTSIALSVIDSDGEIVRQSDNWPSDLNPTSLFSSQCPSTFSPFPPHAQHLPPPVPGQKPPHQQGQEEFLGEAPPPEPPPRSMRPNAPSVKFDTVGTKTGAWRVSTISCSPPLIPIRIAIAVNLQVLDREMSTIRNVFLISIPLVLILVAIGAWGLSGSALEPLHEVTATIRRVTAKGLDQRIPTTGIDVEFVELLQVFNQMMERLERSFKQASRFSADAAHELKTPLAILQGELERTLQQVDRGSELQQRLSHLLDEVCRLSSIVRKLLLLSLADAGHMRLYLVEVDLSQVLADLADDIELLAPELDVQTQIAPGLQVRGDRDLLIQVLQNLISNAIKYNLPGGWVGIDAQRKGSTVSVTVSNRSNDIPANERERIFERFHRGEPARTRNVEGLGLGLSLSREIARAHGGALKLDRTPPGQTAFTLTLPIVDGFVENS